MDLDWKYRQVREVIGDPEWIVEMADYGNTYRVTMIWGDYRDFREYDVSKDKKKNGRDYIIAKTQMVNHWVWILHTELFWEEVPNVTD